MNRLQLFPISTKIENDTLTISGHDLAALAENYGTPLYLYDRATMDKAATGYKSALASHYPRPASVTYAGKAFLNLAIAQWTQSHNLFVDCTGEGEIAIAVAGGVPHEHILVHGVNKSEADLKSAIQHAGTIVVDNLTELHRIVSLFPNPDSRFSNLWLRLLPGVAVETHHAHTHADRSTRQQVWDDKRRNSRSRIVLQGQLFTFNGNSLSSRIQLPRCKSVESGH
jgi:diaminopimelate decarboxylase